ncbi:MAG: DUF2235 domain-containing protein [Planctomycetales bacterium]|nr:DUF2235 domain-containing protein [Planctomycetales bacterium]
MPKNIVICCDGTSNDVVGVSTNVLKLYRCLVRSESQLTCYVPGVGTISDPSMKTGIGKWCSRKLNMGIGYGVRETACSIYRFLSNYFEPGDRIFLFGFSRGAYTVRSVAGMIRFLGLLRKEQIGLEPHAWSIYASDDQYLKKSEFFRAGNRFSKCFCTQPKPEIYFLGLWDTVSSFGWLWNLRTLPYTANNRLVIHARHLVAMDERRAMFKQNLLTRNARGKSFQEVWFPGSHGDIGGGWPNSVDGISRLALKWMSQEAVELGLEINPKELARMIQPPDEQTAPKVRINHSLRGLWWILEFLPRRQWNSRCQRMTWTLPNFGKRRRIPNNAYQQSIRLDG